MSEPERRATARDEAGLEARAALLVPLAVLPVVVALALCPAAAEGARGAPSEATAARIADRLTERREALVAFRRDLHRHPEVSGQEKRTARVVADALEALGLEVERGVGGHGVVGLVRGARPGPVVAFRADMDAVYSDAPDPVPFASETPGVRHICGHDIHTTVGVALAHVFVGIQDQLEGSVKLIFQPAEENVTGARAMIDEGAMEDPRPVAVFAFHTAPLPVGQIGGTPGAALPARSIVTVRLSGPGDVDRAAYLVAASIERTSEGLPPDFATNPGQLVTSDFVLAQVFGSPRGDPASEGAPTRVVGAQISTVSEDGRARARRAVERALDSLAVENVHHTLTYQDRFAPGVVNDPVRFRAGRAAIESAIGADEFVEPPGALPVFSEDFGFFQDEAPGVMFWLGVSSPEKGTVGMPHSPDYVADEESIFIGARAMAAVLLDALAGADW